MAKRSDFVEERRKKRRKQIYDGAVKVFAEKGFHAATTQEIADAAGLAKGTLYEYVKDKEEILILTLEEAIAQINSEIEMALEGIESHEERLRRMNLVHLKFAENYKSTAKVFLYEMSNLSPAGKKRYSELLDSMLARQQKVIDDGIQAGCFKKLDSRLASELFLHTCSFYFGYGDLPHQKSSTEDITNFIMEYFFLTIASHPRGGGKGKR